MFLIDKYYDKYTPYFQKNINEIISSFKTFSNDDEINIINSNDYDKIKLITDSNIHGSYKYSNFQHMIVHGNISSNKEMLVHKLLENIFGKENIILKDKEYPIITSSKNKVKIILKQSKNHIIIEPNSNGFDKYLIQEVIEDYSVSENMNVLNSKKLFNVIVINKIDNLSYYAQASLRRTMEKHSSNCKFILISNQISKIIEPIRSRCIYIGVSSLESKNIFSELLNFITNENIQISLEELYRISMKADNNINTAFLLLEAWLNKTSYENNNNWQKNIDDIVDLIINTSKQLNRGLKKIQIFYRKSRELFYILFITNIPTHTIMISVMKKLLKSTDNILLKNKIVETTSKFEQRLTNGTRHIMHWESYVIALLQLFLNFL